jgi:hypothetical protein
MMTGSTHPLALDGEAFGSIRRRAVLRRVATLFFVLVLLVAGRAGAQVVETPQPFDSAGRVMAITPSIAARLQLTPPAWRITGDYSEARLFALGNEGYVIVVTRPSGVVERYSVTPEEREYLRVRVSTLPPDLPSQVSAGMRRAASNANRATRNAFVRDQVILGLLVYAPSFATTITNNGTAWTAGYLLAAGSSFFGALEASRELNITPAMHHLSTQAAVRGGAIGGLLSYGISGTDDEHAIAAGVFFGSVGGTAAGLYFGQEMREGVAQAAGFGADALAALTVGTLFMAQGDGTTPSERLRPEWALWIGGAALAGYPLGALYARRAPYNVTAGDVYALYVSSVVGVAAAVPFIIDGHPTDREVATALTSGLVLGAVAGERFLVRRVDHSRGDGTLLGLGAIAGGLMAAGLFTLINQDSEKDAVQWAFAAAGGIAGMALTERYLTPDRDAGRTASSRIRFTPGALALAAAGVPGRFPVLNVAF